jgi:hypothetical protein
MGVYEGRAQLGLACRQLLAAWQRTREAWDDANARQLEQRLVQPVEMQTRDAQAAMEQISAAIQAARRDCQ